MTKYQRFEYYLGWFMATALCAFIAVFFIVGILDLLTGNLWVIGGHGGRGTFYLDNAY